MAKFFIDCPIFAWVIAILVMLAGLASISTLPVAQYPTVTPPTIQVSAMYSGASAQTVENTVTQVVEQQMSELDHLLYISSTSDDTATVTLTFAPGTNADITQVQVQNKLQLATPNLPQIVQQLGLSVTKSSSSFLLVLAFVSQDDSGSQRSRELRGLAGAGSDQPSERRRHGEPVRHAVRDAHLARSCKAHAIRPHTRRRATGTAARDGRERARHCRRRAREDRRAVEVLPAGLVVAYSYDTTPFVRQSIADVVKTLSKPSCSCSS